MGNCISKISKDCLLDFEEFMKNKTSFEKGKARLGFDMLTGATNTRIHSCSITNWGVVEGPFLKNELTPKDILCYPKRDVCHPFRIIFKHFSFYKIS